MVDAFSSAQDSSGPSPDAEEETRSETPIAQENDSKTTSPDDREGNEEANRSTQPMKRRRVTRACDECRRKKIKCDGKQPCTHCTVYSYECTYDQPSNRRRNPAPQYIEALENRLQKAEAVLRAVLPGIDLDDPRYDGRATEQVVESAQASAKRQQPEPVSKPDDDAQLQSMVDRTGMLDLDDRGHWDFHGHSSGYAFIRQFKSHFGDIFPPYPTPEVSVLRNRTISQLIDSPKSAHSSPFTIQSMTNTELPPRDVAITLCRNTIDDCCALSRPLHRPTFFSRLDSIYDTDPDHYSNAQIRFLPLLYIVLAVGCCFAKTEHENSVLDLQGYKEAIEQGYQYFDAGRQMMDITDCRDLISLQAVMFMVIFLNSSAKLSTCYAYIGIALRACCRLGLHRSVTNSRFSAIEQEERKRVFWVVRKFDCYVGTMLGLPQMLSDEDIDAEFPAEVHDEYITEAGIQQMPPNIFPLVKATNAHTRLVVILRKVVRHIYPIKGPADTHHRHHYAVSHGRIRELEQELQSWMDGLPMELRPSENGDTELSRVQQLLRMSYAHVQMMLYRPFIHYVSQARQNSGTDKRSFACAAACISVARNIVHIMTEMRRRGLLVGSYWFVMYTTFTAILSLLFFVLENSESPTSKDILKDAMEGHETLKSLARRSMAADRCTTMLTTLFNALPEKLNERRTSVHPTSAPSKKRPPPVAEPARSGTQSPFMQDHTPSSHGNLTPSRTRTLPQDLAANIAKRNSMPNPASITSYMEQTQPRAHLQFSNANTPTGTPISGHSDFPPTMPNANISDMKTVMFPSDNPFAYGNQPISTLEQAQYNGFQDNSADSFTSSTQPTPFGSTPAGLQPGSTSEYSMPPSIPGFDDNSQIGQFGAPYRHLSAPMPPHGPFEVPDMVSEPEQMPTMQEEYWNQANKGAGGGFNSTGVGPSFDELFGQEGWSNNNMWTEQKYPWQY